MKSLTDSHVVGDARALREEEEMFLRSVLETGPNPDSLLADLQGARVQEMNDSGMGSLRFIGSDKRRFGSIYAEVSFEDAGVSVSAALVLDRAGKLFELDVFKADGSPLRRYPSASGVRTVERKA